MRGRKHSDELRAAVIAALLSGQGVNEVATQFSLSKSVVSEWKSELSSEKFERIQTAKRERLIDLIESHLIASLKSAAELAEQAHNEKWRNQQSAENIAVFYGVLSDKSLRLIELISRIFAPEDQTRPVHELPPASVPPRLDFPGSPSSKDR